MAQNFEQLGNLVESQLNLTLRIIQVNGRYAEKMMASHFAMLRGMLQHAALPVHCSSTPSRLPQNEQEKVLTSYCQTCMQEGLDYQRQVLAELSHR